MELNNLRDLYIEQLQDLYSAETQLIEALPILAENASYPELQTAFRTHLDETRQQRDRLAQILRSLDQEPGQEKCKGMEGLIKEANELISNTKPLFGSDSPESVRDAGLIAAAQRAEHYEIAGYGTVCTYAEMLGRSEDLRYLKETLSEEKMTDEKLTRIAEQVVNPEALHAH